MEQRGRMEWMSRSKKGGGGEVCVQKRGPDSFSPSAHLSPPPPKQRCWVGPSPSVPAAPSPYFPPSLDDASVSIAVLLCCFVAAHHNAVGRSHMSPSPPLPLVGWPKTLQSWQRIGYFQKKVLKHTKKVAFLLAKFPSFRPPLFSRRLFLVSFAK